VRKRDNPEAAKALDLFHLGSDTKAMTATLIALFVEKGDLGWDDTLGKTFPELADDMTPQVRKITLTQLLTHHAGLPYDPALGWFLIPRKGSLRDQRQAVLRLVAGAKLDSEPGEKFAYSNLGYVLAAHVAEKAEKADWEDLIDGRLFQPLGMKTAGFGAMGTPGKVDQPWQHKADGTPIEPGPNEDNPPVMGPAGRVHCSLPDWARFVALQLRAGQGKPALLQPDTFTLLHTTPFKDSGYVRDGWMGIPEDKRAGGLVLAHDGSNTQNYCTAWLAPERRRALLVACNQGGDSGRKACAEAQTQILDAYLPAR
jgi:CubicO group peptidase (beta-lactamase class C family)